MLNVGNLGDQAVEGENYLEICEASEGIHSVGGRSFADGLRSVLDGRVDQFVMEYPLSDEDYSQWLLGRINGFENDGKRYAFVLYENISEYQYKDFQVSQQHMHIPTLLETVKSVISMLDLQELLNTILEKLEKLIHYNSGAVFTIEDSAFDLKAYHGPPLPELTPILLSPNGRHPEIHRLVTNRHSSFVQNINEIPGLLVEISEILNLDIKYLQRFLSWLFLPMQINENQIGIMILAYHKEAYYDHTALRIGELFANFAAIAIQNAHLYELSQQTGILKERNRLAYELHDSIAQSLYSMNLYASATRRALDLNKSEIAKNHLLELQSISGNAVKDMRLMIFELNNQLIDGFGIIRAIQARFEVIEAKLGIQTSLIVEGDLVLPNHVECEAYGIIQELLNYLEKTTQTKNISIKIMAGKGRNQFIISLDKILYPREVTEAVNIEHFNRIKNRVRKLGGSLQFDHLSSQVTEIKFDLLV
jgi:nitrate/nitrite-specific signal transduction histidine kinase